MRVDAPFSHFLSVIFTFYSIMAVNICSEVVKFQDLAPLIFLSNLLPVLPLIEYFWLTSFSCDDNGSFLHFNPRNRPGLARGGEALRLKRSGAAGTEPLFRSSVPDQS